MEFIFRIYSISAFKVFNATSSMGKNKMEVCCYCNCMVAFYSQFILYYYRPFSFGRTFCNSFMVRPCSNLFFCLEWFDIGSVVREANGKNMGNQMAME